jgi:hypothetical protein
MLHTTLPLARLFIGQRELRLTHATLVVVARHENPDLDWEIVAHTVEVEPLARTVHELRFEAIVGLDGDHLELVDLSGAALVTRTHENAVVLRGNGPIHGFNPGLLT